MAAAAASAQNAAPAVLANGGTKAQADRSLSPAGSHNAEQEEEWSNGTNGRARARHERNAHLKVSRPTDHTSARAHLQRAEHQHPNFHGSWRNAGTFRSERRQQEAAHAQLIQHLHNDVREWQGQMERQMERMLEHMQGLGAHSHLRTHSSHSNSHHQVSDKPSHLPLVREISHPNAELDDAVPGVAGPAPPLAEIHAGHATSLRVSIDEV